MQIEDGKHKIRKRWLQIYELHIWNQIHTGKKPCMKNDFGMFLLVSRSYYRKTHIEM
jgi:hypothetical protein